MNEKVMIFVDGSNLLRGVGQEIGKKIDSVKPNDDELHLSAMIVNTLWSRLSNDAFVGSVDGRVVRRYWFGSFVGGDQQEQRIKKCLRKSNFEPVLFKKLKAKGKEKRVDIAIARELLINASNRNMDIAILVAGDEDYVDLVQDIKRYGVRITGSFFERGTSPLLRLAVDYFHQLNIWGDGHKELVKKIKS
ncbi:MAG: NYN domain-containing protein [Thermodesulfobacteriota bacterium]|nr:NYN domain-containing protein [Thermodesulfobacteriota bacterium]